jgi:hypothetical protein
VALPKIAEDREGWAFFLFTLHLMVCGGRHLEPGFVSGQR